MKMLARIREKFGDFWWWSLCLFLAARSGDLINAFVGLWLVPKYVPQEELGAVLPLTQVTGVIGLPISVLVVTFSKFLAEYAAKGEKGKIKSMMRVFLGTTVIAVVVCYAVAGFILPLFFERIRVANGSLGVIIIASAALGTMAPMFGNALQGLQKFKAMTVIGMLVAPIRLVVMLVAMPFRALSGYMLGQAAPSFMSIVLSWIALRKERDPSIVPVSFWREDGRRIVKYTCLVAVNIGLGVVAGAIQSLVIRQRMSDMDSAAYYMISRFSELAIYAGTTLSLVMFPLAAEASAKGQNSFGLLVKMSIGTALFGFVCTLGLWMCGGVIFSLIPVWNAYASYVPDMALLAAVFTISSVNGCFMNFEIANGRFGFLWYAVPLGFMQIVFYPSFAGYAFFDGILPPTIVQHMASLQIWRLHNMLLAMLAFSVFGVVCNGMHIAVRKFRQCLGGHALILLAQKCADKVTESKV